RQCVQVVVRIDSRQLTNGANSGLTRERELVRQLVFVLERFVGVAPYREVILNHMLVRQSDSHLRGLDVATDGAHDRWHLLSSVGELDTASSCKRAARHVEHFYHSCARYTAPTMTQTVARPDPARQSGTD